MAEAAGATGVKAARVVAASNNGGGDIRGSSKAALDSDGEERQPGRVRCGTHTHTRDARVYI